MEELSLPSIWLSLLTWWSVAIWEEPQRASLFGPPHQGGGSGVLVGQQCCEGQPGFTWLSSTPDLVQPCLVEGATLCRVLLWLLEVTRGPEQELGELDVLKPLRNC